MFCPKHLHELSLKRIGRYLKQTPDRGMVMDPSSDVCKIADAYPDADFASMFGHEDHTDPACAKSRTGFIITFADCPVFWQSKLQTETALSTMEAEIIALSACCRELFPIMDMVSLVTKSVKLPIGKTTMNVSIHEDNSGALVLAKTLPPQFTPPQLRRFGFVKKSSREMCNYLKLTQPNNWVISLRKVSHFWF